MMVRLIFVELGKNSCKFWHGEIVGTTLKTNWGRVGDAGQFKDYAFSSTWAAQDKLDSLVNSKLRKGYTRQQVIVDGMPVASIPTNIHAVATSQIKHGDNPETLELINFLVKRNIHAIEGTTTIRYVNGGLQTPLGPVTPEGLDEAERLLMMMVLPNADLAKLADHYLRIVPRILPRKGADPADLFGTTAQIQAEKALIDSMRAVVVDDSTPTNKVFETTLDLLSPDSAAFKRVNKAFVESVNKNHASARLRLARVWKMEIASAAAAFEKELKPIERLWHGTKDANLLSILKGGYVIPGRSSSIAVTGRMYGDGVYFSDQSTKSLNYATGSAPGQHGAGASLRKFMLWNDVAMGNKFMARSSFSGGCPSGFDSTFAKAGQGGVMNNEMIVYRTSQINPRFLCEFVG